MTLTESDPIPRYPSPTSSNLSAKSASPTVAVPVPSTSLKNPQDETGDGFYDVDLASSLDGVDAEGLERWSNIDTLPVAGRCPVGSLHGPQTESVATGDCDGATKQPERPFHRWVRTLHRRALRRQGLTGVGGHVSGHTAQGMAPTYRPRHCRKSSTGSSTAFVTGVRSASVSLSSLPRSRRNTLRYSQRHSNTGRSTRTSISGARSSIDSTYRDASVSIDPAVMERSLQRRRILEELIDTEEGYIGDVRFLMNVGCRLSSCPFLDSIRTKP